MPADAERHLGGWSCAAAAAGSITDPGGLADAGLDWVAATVPGTAASALADAGRWQPGSAHDFDAEDWWWRVTFERPAGPGWELSIDGLATLGDVWLNGHHLLQTANMFRSYRAELDDHLADQNELVVRCAALAPALAGRRRPRPRWKAQLPSDQSLRWIRTTLLGRSPNWSPDVAPVGPWRPMVVRRGPEVDLDRRRLHADHDGTDGHLNASFRLVSPADACGAAASVDATLVVDTTRVPLHVTHEPTTGDVTLSGRVVVPGAEAWWPATHGPQSRYPAQVELRTGATESTVALGPIGFRAVTFGPPEAPELRWNGVPLFGRGAGWTPIDPIGLHPSADDLRRTLTQLRDAGLNLVRLQGSFVYETDQFYDLCDELGLLVWQDLMFATLDYPADDPGFVDEVVAEVSGVLDRLQAHPCVAVVCGGNEVFQQAAMLGRPADRTGDPLFAKLLADLMATHLPGVPYLAGSPSWTGDAFTVDSGVAHYFGVGAYRRPLGDARSSGVRFAGECLAFSLVPGDETVADLAAVGARVGTAAWKARVPQDRGRSWDFEDVRDHYARERFGVEPAGVRVVDPDHYLDLGRAAMAEVVTRTTSEWRRAASPCTGAILLQARDLVAGPGFGPIDRFGRPKSAWFALRRALLPQALLLSDEGLNGLAIEAVNDGPEPVFGTLGVRAFAGPNVVADGEIPWRVAARSATVTHADEVLGGFYDVTFAYRFGPRSIDCVAVDWRPDDAPPVHAVFLPGGEALVRSDIGLAASLRLLGTDAASPGDAAGQERVMVSELTVTTVLAARCVLIDAPGAEVSDDAFDLEPGGRATVTVRSPGPVRIEVRAVNGLRPVTATRAEDPTAAADDDVPVPEGADVRA